MLTSATAVETKPEDNFNWREAVAALKKKVEILTEFLAPMKVLLVDDDYNDLILEQRSLEAYNCIVEACNTAEKAVQAVSKDKYDLVVIDFRLPTMSGVELMRHIRSVSPSTRMVIATGMPIHPVVDEVTKLGAVWAAKPLSDQVIKTFLRSKPPE